MKLLCDQMLIRLGRWLRAAGYDTFIIKEYAQDNQILQLAKKEKRILITRDKKMQNLDPEGEDIICLTSNTTKDCALELSKRLNINWLVNPFSRCLECNGLLIETSSPDPSQVPSNFQTTIKRFWVCTDCKKVYWEGSHTKRMLKQLKEWQN